jgi:hypothetical protein
MPDTYPKQRLSSKHYHMVLQCLCRLDPPRNVAEFYFSPTVRGGSLLGRHIEALRLIELRVLVLLMVIVTAINTTLRREVQHHLAYAFHITREPATVRIG